MTFKEYLTRNPNLYDGLNLDEPLKQSLFDWFQFREVCDDDKFNVFYTRLIKNHLNKYQQLLRIEPGISSFDWLVQTYHENQKILQAQEKENHSKEVNSTSIGQTDSTQSGTIKDELTRNGSDLTEINNTNNKTLTNDLTDTSNGSMTKGQQVNSKDDTFTKGQEVHDISDTTNGERNNDIKNSSFGIVDDKKVDKLLPMEVVGITKSDINFDHEKVAEGLFGLDWSNATSQSENTNVNEGTSTTSDKTTTKDTKTNKSTFGQRIDTTKDTLTEGERKDINSTTTTSTGTQTTNDTDEGTNKITYDSGEDNTRTLDLTNNQGFNSQDNSNENGAKNRDELRVDRMQHSGRTIPIPVLLQQATDFIKQSCAFDYLREELEPAFICFFEI